MSNSLKITAWICCTIIALCIIGAITYSADSQPYHPSPPETPQQQVNDELQQDYSNCIGTVDSSQVSQCISILKGVK